MLDFFSHWTWLDWGMTAFLGFCVWHGVQTGLVIVMTDVIGLATAWYLGTHYATWGGHWILQMDMTSQTHTANILASGVIYIVTFLVFNLIGKMLSKELHLAFPLAFLDMLCGGLLGFTKGILILGVVIFPAIYFHSSLMQHSQLLQQLEPRVSPWLHKVSVNKVEQYLPEDVDTDKILHQTLHPQ